MIDRGEYRSVLCGLDIEQGAGRGLGERGASTLRAADAATARGARLVLVHALPVNPGVPMSPQALEQSLLERERLSKRIIDALLEAVERLTGRKPSEVQVLVEDGPPARAILDVAGRLRCDLIVVGHSGAARKDLLRRLLGSVATAVAREAPCSVLVVRPS